MTDIHRVESTLPTNSRLQTRMAWRETCTTIQSALDVATGERLLGMITHLRKLAAEKRELTAEDEATLRSMADKMRARAAKLRGLERLLRNVKLPFLNTSDVHSLINDVESEASEYEKFRDHFQEKKSVDHDDVFRLDMLVERLQKYNTVKRQADFLVQRWRPLAKRHLLVPPRKEQSDEAKLMESALFLVTNRAIELKKRLCSDGSMPHKLTEWDLREIQSIADKVIVRAHKLRMIREQLTNIHGLIPAEVIALCSDLEAEAKGYEQLRDTLLTLREVTDSDIALLDDLILKMKKYDYMKPTITHLACYKPSPKPELIKEAEAVQSAIDICTECAYAVKIRIKDFLGNANSIHFLSGESVWFERFASKVQARSSRLQDIYNHLSGFKPEFFDINQIELDNLCAELKNEAEFYDNLTRKVRDMKAVTQDDVSTLDQFLLKMDEYQDLKRRADRLVQWMNK